ncbi:maleylpyruvate isomerase N-terminal domain-containing protein [Aureibacter tunicatorum]|uniref:Mycothiol-dependent maleylpyruvate isomerase metal-binding domain-containing protein n=1 Tax=Aureibacter tunicatorum TaxID=866807 RepID=A0AAE3XRL0_9BACT|nr:maleylpyruvate isomerase N-terminal domain-containing protein [Aureibacter tunicatorum]MDR6240616.1 hypothetical protein [Aureibacter tunicatorum]BDD06523.1 hypothetical protein AUTU_40060 [Aureibacter tunicatorum]
MIDIVHKFPELDAKLIELLQSLEQEEWNKPTVAKLWAVKDVAAHLLDGNIRILSGLRDHHHLESPEINSYQDLLDFLNHLNAEWVQSMKRVSPEMLLDLLEHTGKPYCDYYASLDPFGKALYPVAWAGENESKNWMHIARDYTEKFLHQQQIRDAVGKQGIMSEEYFLPFLEVCMYALPHALRNAAVVKGSVLKMSIVGEVNGEWLVRFNGEIWELIDSIPVQSIKTEVTIDSYASWKLFSKSLRYADLKDKIEIKGDIELGRIAVDMVSFMA